MHKHRAKIIRLLEFFVVGVLLGIVEDVLAIAFATDATINARVVVIAAAVAIPFAFVSELIVDHPRFWQAVWPNKR